MQPFRYHVFACEQRKPEGLPCCSARGAVAVIDALRREVASRGLMDTVQVTASGSLGLCERGPNLVVYPEGVWYSGVTAADVPEIVSEHFIHGRVVSRLANTDESSLRSEITENRTRMMAALRARDAAGVVPDELQELVRGFQASRVILTGIELDVFTAVERAGAAANADEVARQIGADPRATEVLLNALVALDLLTKGDGVFGNGAMARRFLVEGARDDARFALRHNLSLWATWSTLSECVRGGRAVPTEMAARGDDWTVPFIAAMHKNAALRAPMIVNAVGAGGVRRMLDVGGGSGAYSIAFAHANPALVADVLDLQTVTPITEAHVAAAGLSGRVRARVGDLRRDELGSGYDLVLLSAICHMLSPDENRELFARAAAALVPGGRLVIQDHVMQPDKTAPRSGALFAVNMLVGTAGGSSYSGEEYRAWLAGSGFTDVAHVKLPGPNDLLVARRP